MHKEKPGKKRFAVSEMKHGGTKQFPLPVFLSESIIFPTISYGDEVKALDSKHTI
jgi:hypothetical protein